MLGKSHDVTIITESRKHSKLECILLYSMENHIKGKFYFLLFFSTNFHPYTFLNNLHNNNTVTNITNIIIRNNRNIYWRFLRDRLYVGQDQCSIKSHSYDYYYL